MTFGDCPVLDPEYRAGDRNRTVNAHLLATRPDEERFKSRVVSDWKRETVEDPLKGVLGRVGDNLDPAAVEVLEHETLQEIVDVPG